jgi:hypothetical protein
MTLPTRMLLMAALGLAMSATRVAGANAAPASTPPSYTLTEIASGQNFVGQYMNAFGEIVGYIPGPIYYHAAVYAHGNLIDLGAKINPFLNSQAYYVNLQGEVLLITTNSKGINTGYTYKSGRFTALQFPPGASMNGFAGLNDFGFAVGDFIDPTNVNGSRVSGFLLWPDGALVKLPIVPTSDFCINDIGQIVGDYRTVGSDVLTLREPGGRLISIPMFNPDADLNQLGHLCTRDNFGTNVYLYANGHTTNLGYLPGHPPVLPNAYNYSTIYSPAGINDLDSVIGTVDSNIGGIFETGWVYMNGQMYDLTQCVTPKTGFLILDAVNILDDGRILANGSSTSIFGPYQTVVLTPTPKKYIRP